MINYFINTCKPEQEVSRNEQSIMSIINFIDVSNYE